MAARERPLGVAKRVDEDVERPPGGNAGIQLAKGAGGRVPGIHEERLAFGESLAFISLLVPAWGALVAIGQRSWLIEPQGNYGNLLFFWDVLFGTAKITRRYPAAFGVENLPPASLGQQLLWPVFGRRSNR